MIIFNTTPLILFLKELNYVDIFNYCLDIDAELIIPFEVYEEFIGEGKEKLNSLISNNVLIVKEVKKDPLELIMKKHPQLGAGESSVLAFGEEHKLDKNLLIIDERRASNIANSMNLNSIGSMGLLFLLNKKKILSKKDLCDIAKQINTSSFYFDFKKQGLEWLLK
ncbi:MAG: hypothetical protein ACOC1K_07935 [Nanoarchaeota archaeon]